MFDKEAYLKRIDLTGPINNDIAGLVALHLAQSHNIPFENLDILLGRDVNLEPDVLFSKLVTQKRGGYCFELNGLFRQALAAFGFNVRSLLARVHISGQSNKRSHKLCLVSFDDQHWLADVGFGAQGFKAPIPLVEEFNNKQDGRIYRLIKHDKYGIMMQFKTKSTWLDLYSFELSEICSGDIIDGNNYSSKHQDSVFTQLPIVTMPTKDGRITLRHDNLRVEGASTVVDNRISKSKDYNTALYKYFGLNFSSQEAEILFNICK